jgi:hypothetical protein
MTKGRVVVAAAAAAAAATAAAARASASTAAGLAGSTADSAAPPVARLDRDDALDHEDLGQLRQHELAHARPTTTPACTVAALAHADAAVRRPHCLLLDVLFRRRHGIAAVLGAPLGAPSAQLALRTSRDELVFSNP